MRDGVELLSAETQARPVQFVVVGADAEDVFSAFGAAFNAVDHPLQNTHVFTVTGPDKLAVFAFAEPVDAVNGGQLGAAGLQLLAQLQPVLEIVAHVVAHEGQHGEGVAAHHALLTSRSSRGLRAHGGGHVDAFHPVAGFGDQGHGGRAATAKNEGVDGDTCGVVPGAVEGGVVGGGHREAGVRVRGFGAGLFGDGRGPVLALPVDAMRGRVAHAFPPNIAVVGQRHVGEDHVAVQAGHAVRVGQGVGARGHAKVTGFGVDGTQAAVSTRFDPSDVVTDGGDFPARHARGRDQHGEIGFATGAGEGRGDVVFLALGVGDAQNQHVLGQPALVAAHVGGDAQCKAFFAQQRIAAVARAVRPDFAGLGVMHDVLGFVARPADVFVARVQRCAHGVHAGHELAVLAQHLIHGLAHAGHDFHVDRHVGAVGQLDADVGDRAAQGAHGKRHHVHGATSHAAVKQRLQGLAHLGRCHPVVGRAGVFFVF